MFLSLAHWLTGRKTPIYLLPFTCECSLLIGGHAITVRSLGFVWAGMTNRKDMIDEALIRPGRLEVQMEIGELPFCCLYFYFYFLYNFFKFIF